MDVEIPTYRTSFDLQDGSFDLAPRVGSLLIMILRRHTVYGEQPAENSLLTSNPCLQLPLVSLLHRIHACGS